MKRLALLLLVVVLIAAFWVVKSKQNPIVVEIVDPSCR